jgi:hypothetical protein
MPITLERQGATLVTNMRLGPIGDIVNAQHEFGCLQSLRHVSKVEDSGMHWGHCVPSVLFSPARIVTTPLVDMIGTPAWDVMQRRTTILFNREVPHNVEKCDIDPGAVIHGPLYKLGNALGQASLKTRDLKSRGKLILIGHSMGAILCAELLNRFPEIHFDRIIFMAAACRVRDLTDFIWPYLARRGNHETIFYNLTLHPQAETRESNFFRLAPEGSLLVWIDQWFDKPDAILDRTAGRYVNLGMSGRYLDQEALKLEAENPGSTIGERIFFKIFPYQRGKAPKRPMTHGSFVQFGEKSPFNFWEEDFYTE